MAEKPPESPDVSKMFKEVLEVLQESGNLDEVREADDVDTLTQQMEETMAQLNERADELYKATGMSKEQLQEFAEKKENFSEEEWKLLNEVREQVVQFQEKAEHIIDEGLLEKLDVAEAPPPPKKKPPKKKQGSTKRVKRKDWMGG